MTATKVWVVMMTCAGFLALSAYFAIHNDGFWQAFWLGDAATFLALMLLTARLPTKGE